MSERDARLIDLLCAVFGVTPEDIRPDKGRGTLKGWDSLRHLKLIMAIEEEFGIELTQEEIESIATVADIKQALTVHGI